jgi:hypothetical protein
MPIMTPVVVIVLSTSVTAGTARRRERAQSRPDQYRMDHDHVAIDQAGVSQGLGQFSAAEDHQAGAVLLQCWC